MQSLVFLEPDCIKAISLDELMKNPQSEMEWLKKEEPVIYNYFIENNLTLYYLNSEIRVTGEDFDLPFELFTRLMTKRKKPILKIIK